MLMLCVSARSATNIQGRPVLRKLLADAHGGLVDLILIKSISRLSRNTVNLLKDSGFASTITK